jgi:hypothetical protein
VLFPVSCRRKAAVQTISNLQQPQKRLHEYARRISPTHRAEHFLLSSGAALG